MTSSLLGRDYLFVLSKDIVVVIMFMIRAHEFNCILALVLKCLGLVLLILIRRYRGSNNVCDSMNVQRLRKS